jgi:putative oxidoreductase
MSTVDAFAQRWSPYLLSVLRIVVAALFLAHGTKKLLGFPGDGVTGDLPPLILLAAWLEAGGGGLLVLGLGTRPVAFVLSGLMAVAYFMAHAQGGFFPILNGGELAVLYCFVFFYFAFAGGGPVSLDRLFRRKAPGQQVDAVETTSI